MVKGYSPMPCSRSKELAYLTEKLLITGLKMLRAWLELNVVTQVLRISVKSEVWTIKLSRNLALLRVSINIENFFYRNMHGVSAYDCIGFELL